MPSQAVPTYDSMERYRRGVNRGHIGDLLGKISGSNNDLVSYDAVANRLRAHQQIEMGTRMVPLNQIVGSVGRYRDFTRTFLPRERVNAERWARVDHVMHSMEGWPPVELYQIGEVYFVRDGNHRVSVARVNGLNQIEAYVTELETDIDLTLEDFERDQWIIKIERAEFLHATGLDALRPHHAVALTEPGHYQILLRHIRVHYYLRNLDLDREGREQLTWEEAVASWYDHVYMPVVDAIHASDLLKDFPSRTETDLYLWIAYHREDLARRYNLAPLSPAAAVSTFAQTHSEVRWQQAMKSLRNGLLHITQADVEKPLGLSEEEFAEAKARYEAGERTLGEAEEEDRLAGEERPADAGVDDRADAEFPAPVEFFPLYSFDGIYWY